MKIPCEEQMTGVRMCSENYRKLVIAVCHAHLVQLLTQLIVGAAASTAAHSLWRHFRKHNLQRLTYPCDVTVHHILCGETQNHRILEPYTFSVTSSKRVDDVVNTKQKAGIMER